MNKAQETSRLYEIVAQSIQKRIIYPSRENVTLNHDTWELKYETVCENYSHDSYEGDQYNYNAKKNKTSQIPLYIGSAIIFLLIGFSIHYITKPYYEVYKQDKFFFERHNEIHFQIVEKIKKYERPIDDIKKYEEIYTEETKIQPRLGELKKCEQCSYLKSYVEALLYFDEYKQDGNIEHIKKANTLMKDIPSSYKGACADQINYSRDYFRKIEDEFEKQRLMQAEQNARAVGRNRIDSSRYWFEKHVAESNSNFEKTKRRFWFYAGVVFIIRLIIYICTGR